LAEDKGGAIRNAWY